MKFYQFCQIKSSLTATTMAMEVSLEIISSKSKFGQALILYNSSKPTDGYNKNATSKSTIAEETNKEENEDDDSNDNNDFSDEKEKDNSKTT
eukprot:12392046-Ditylum_brightwellii.AAC.1